MTTWYKIPFLQKKETIIGLLSTVHKKYQLKSSTSISQLLHEFDLVDYLIRKLDF
jgi:hypothetical protein